MRFFLILLIAVVFFGGCGSSKRVVVEKQQLPAWYLNPNKTNSGNLYALGEGEDKNEAVANALSNMLSTLNVSISSEFNTKSTVKEGIEQSYSSTSTNEVRSRVEKIKITDYEVINSKEFGFKKYLVEIKSDKRKLFDGLRKELEQRFAAIQSRNMQAQKQSVIKELSAYRDAVQSTADVKNIVAVMGSLNPLFNGDVFLNKRQELENRYSDLASKISFSVKSNNDAVGLKSVIGKGLSFKKYTIQNIRGRYHFTVYIESTTQKAASYGFDLARSAISITVKENSGSIVGSNKLNIIGQSTQGYRVAKESVAVKLNEMIKKEGIANILGLDI